MSPQARGIRRSRIHSASWLGAIAVHAVIAGLLLQFGAEPARSNVPSRPDVEAVRVQAADGELLQQRREAHRRALREEELRKQREREAKRKQAEEQKREEKAHRKAEEKKAKAQAEAKRKAKEEAKRNLAEKRMREEAARRKAEEEKRAAERAEARRRVEEEARKLEAAEQQAEARRQEQAQRRQREAARRARQIEAWRVAIKQRIERFWLQPPAAHISPCEAVVEQDETGRVLSVGVRGCRASQAWQDSLRNAVLKASPLPPPSPAELFDRRLIITFHPKRAR